MYRVEPEQTVSWDEGIARQKHKMREFEIAHSLQKYFVSLAFVLFIDDAVERSDCNQFLVDLHHSAMLFQINLTLLRHQNDDGPAFRSHYGEFFIRFQSWCMEYCARFVGVTGLRLNLEIGSGCSAIIQADWPPDLAILIAVQNRRDANLPDHQF